MRAESAADDDPLDQDADSPEVDDPAVARWFLRASERGNDATDLRSFSTGNDVVPLIDGREYFSRLCTELEATEDGDEVYFVDFRGDLDERLGGEGSEVGRVFARASSRGVAVFGLLWRSHPSWLNQSEGANAEFVRHISDAGGHVLLDARTRRAGSHHQKLVVIRRRRAPGRDVAFVGGIDLGHGRHDDGDHAGDPQSMEFPDEYGERPPWHDIQVEVRGPAVHDLEHSFRERWYGSSVLDVPSPLRQLYDRTYFMGAMTGRPLPEPVDSADARVGSHAVQVLRTYPARLRRYPFAPLGEQSIVHAYEKAFGRASRLVYLEDQYLWSRHVARTIADALRRSPELRVIVVVPRFPDNAQKLARVPELLARQEAMDLIRAAAGDRFAVYDLENPTGVPVYVHAKVVVVDDVWAMVGSDNLNRRSWTHDSELSIAIVDERHDEREPRDPAGDGDGARRFARDLRLRLWREHLDRDGDDVLDLLDPDAAFDAFAQQAERLDAWYAQGKPGARPPGRVRPHRPVRVGRAQAVWARPLLRVLHDPDGRPLRERVRSRW